MKLPHAAAIRVQPVLGPRAAGMIARVARLAQGWGIVLALHGVTRLAQGWITRLAQGWITRLALHEAIRLRQGLGTRLAQRRVSQAI